MMAFAPFIAEPGSSHSKGEARKARKVEIAALLLERGADVKLPDVEGVTALHRVVSSYYPETTVEMWTRRLLEAGAIVDAMDARGVTALQIAVRRRRLGAAKILISAGADPTLSDMDGDSAESLARAGGLTELVELLENRRRQ